MEYSFKQADNGTIYVEVTQRHELQLVYSTKQYRLGENGGGAGCIEHHQVLSFKAAGRTFYMVRRLWVYASGGTGQMVCGTPFSSLKEAKAAADWFTSICSKDEAPTVETPAIGTDEAISNLRAGVRS